MPPRLLGAWTFRGLKKQEKHESSQTVVSTDPTKKITPQNERKKYKTPETYDIQAPSKAPPKQRSVFCWKDPGDPSRGQWSKPQPGALDRARGAFGLLVFWFFVFFLGGYVSNFEIQKIFQIGTAIFDSLYHEINWHSQAGLEVKHLTSGILLGQPCQNSFGPFFSRCLWIARPPQGKFPSRLALLVGEFVVGEWVFVDFSF